MGTKIEKIDVKKIVSLADQLNELMKSTKAITENHFDSFYNPEDGSGWDFTEMFNMFENNIRGEMRSLKDKLQSERDEMTCNLFGYYVITRKRGGEIEPNNMRHYSHLGKDIDIIEPALLLKDAAPLISGLEVGYVLTRIQGMQKPAKVKVKKSTIKDAAVDAAVDVAVDADISETSLHDFESFANTDYVVTNPGFMKEFSDLSKKLVNHLLYDDLTRFKTVFSRFKTNCVVLLKRHGYSDILQTSNTDFFIRLLAFGIGADIRKRFHNNYALSLQSFLFSQRICKFALDGCIQSSVITAFTQYRESQIHTIMLEQSENGTMELATGITKFLMRPSVYTMLIASIIEDERIGGNSQDVLGKKLQACFILPPKRTVNTEITRA